MLRSQVILSDEYHDEFIAYFLCNSLVGATIP